MTVIFILPNNPSGSQKMMIEESQFSSEKDHADMTVVRHPHCEHIFIVMSLLLISSTALHPGGASQSLSLVRNSDH